MKIDGSLREANTATHLFHVDAVEVRYLFGVIGGVLLYFGNELFWTIVATLRGNVRLRWLHIL